MAQPRESIQLSDWLASRTPAPPTEMFGRLKEIIGDIAVRESEIPSALLDRAVEVLASVGTDRDAAIDLLAADALITYAMEASAELNQDVADFSSQAAKKVAEVYRG